MERDDVGRRDVAVLVPVHQEGDLEMSQGLSWKYVFNGTLCFASGRRKQDARQTALDYGYKFYLWVSNVYWTATDEDTGIMVDDLF
jgi:hypothetical protein